MTETQIAAAQPSAVDRHVQTPRGSVFIRDLPGVDPVVVHGYPDDHKIYTRLTPLLAPHRVVAFDFLGCGRSDRSDCAGVTIVFGTADRYLNSCLASELHYLFGPASLDLIADAGHYPQHDQPQAVAALIQRALSA
jgi:pimeloyl-ACP methyl ester carboxylesterase